jgi:5-methylcytosine-specific restriction endonuclease McrA
LKSQRKNKSRAIPSATRTHIWQRDGGACTYTDPTTGHRCNSRHFIQLDHIHPVALGGTNEPENLRLLCGQHNRWRAEQTFGPRPAAPA